MLEQLHVCKQRPEPVVCSLSNSANGLCERSQCIKRWFLGTKAMRGYRRAASLHKRKPIWHDNRTTNGSSKWSKSM